MAAIALKYSADSDWRLAATRNPFHSTFLWEIVQLSPITFGRSGCRPPCTTEQARARAPLAKGEISAGEIAPRPN